MADSHETLCVWAYGKFCVTIIIQEIYLPGVL